MSSFSHDFAKMFDKPNGGISSLWVWSGLWKALVQGGRPNTAIPGTGPLVFVPTEVAVCKLSRTCVCVSLLWLSIIDVFHVDNNFQECLMVKTPSEEEEWSGKTPQRHGSNLDLGRCFLSFNLRVVKTISGALCWQ